MRGGATGHRFRLPLIRSTSHLLPASEEKVEAHHFAEQSFSVVVDIAAAAEKP